MREVNKIKDSIGVLYPKGDLSIGPAIEFERFVEQVQKDNPKLNLIFDMSNVEYMSSSFLRVLVTVYRKQKERGLTFAICNCNSYSSDIIHMIKLDDVLPVCETLEQAIVAVS